MKQIVLSILVVLLLLVSAGIVILLARGYRLNTDDNSLDSTGILVTKSEPDGAQVYIDGVFSGATNSTINLPPNWYKVRISREGYHDWERDMRIQGEVVSQTDAVLFLKNPSLSPLISTGVVDPIMSPDGTKLAYIATPSAEQLNRSGNQTETDGESIFESNLTRPTLFIYDLMSRNLPFSRNPQPYPGTIDELLAEWELERETTTALSLRAMPDEFEKIATNSLQILSFAPDGSKVLYEATSSATLTRVFEPALIGGLPTEEVRDLTPGMLYVYDQKDDRNYKIDFPAFETMENTPNPIQWIGTSRHFVLTDGKIISIMEYDGANRIPVYSGPFVNGHVFPHPVGHQLIIMTTLNSQLGDLPSLYTLTIR